MRTMKKVLSLVMALALVLSLGITAMAADDTYTITVDEKAEGYVYGAYQIFAGDLFKDEDEKLVLSNVEWGTGVDQDKLETALAGTAFAGKTAAEISEMLTAGNAADFAAAIAKALSTTKTTSTEEKGPYTMTGLKAGYYLVKNESVPEDGAYTEFMLKVVENVKSEPKSDVPSVEKKVMDVNDSTGDKSEWQDSADYDVNDKVPFRLKGTLPSNLDSYDSYTYIFHDTMDDSLVLDEDSIEVYVGTTKLEGGYRIVTDTDHCTFEVVFDDITKIDGVTKDSVIYVEFKATLTDDAVRGSAGNWNEVGLEFSNDPNWDGEGDEPTGNTPKDKVVVFTYELDVNKVDPDGNALPGAAFALYKQVTEGTEGAEADDEGNYWILVKEYKVENQTTFAFSGLDDGHYKLVETETPNGYNSIDPIEFDITAEHDELADTPTLKSLETTLPAVDDDGKDTTVSGNLGTGVIETDIENNKGVQLPSTGGIGTTIFYVAGTILLVGAAILLVAKRRVTAE